jgi:hypothetical protein
MDSHPVKFNWLSSDGTVHAYLRWPAPGECNIHKFAAEEPFKNQERRALQELRVYFQTLRFTAADSWQECERAFWLSMAQQGLIDVVTDRDGTVIWPPQPMGP